MTAKKKSKPITMWVLRDKSTGSAELNDDWEFYFKKKDAQYERGFRYFPNGYEIVKVEVREI